MFRSTARQFKKEAKAEGPLQSLGASGTIGGTLTFGRSRGFNFVRARVTPRNPQSAKQSAARIVLSFNGAASSRMNLNQVGKRDGATMTPKEYYESIQSTMGTWVSEFMRRGFPDGTITFAADQAAWSALEAGEMTAWNTWNDAFANSFAVVVAPPGGAANVVAGAAAFTWARALARGGYIPTVPTTTPPTWDNTLKAMTRDEVARMKKYPDGVLPEAALAQAIKEAQAEVAANRKRKPS